MLLFCSCSSFAQNAIIYSVRGSDYLTRISSKSVQCSFELKETLFWHGTEDGTEAARERQHRLRGIKQQRVKPLSRYVLTSSE